jgi:lambda family phage portal protein
MAGVISSFFPEWSARRAEAKVKAKRAELKLKLMERAFDAASLGRRNDGWRSGGADANAENAPALARMRNRARELRRNNPYAERAISGIADNMVGYGIVPRPLARTDRQRLRLTDLWKAWAETSACDADGLRDMYAIQHMAAEAAAQDGEILIRRRRRFSSDGLPVPLQLQVLEADFLDETKDGEIAGTQNRIIQGIEFDALGRRIAYWLYDTHPGANNTWLSLDSRRVPAEDVIHLFLPKRPGQARGYSWLSPVMQRMRNFDEMEDAVIEQAKVAACFAAFVTGDDGDGTATGAKSPLIDHVEPGIVQQLGAGESVTFGSPPTFNGYQSYSWQALHAIAVGMGVPYELLVGDLKGVNFSSGRMGWLEFGRRIDAWRWHMMIPMLCARVWDWFIEAQMLLPGGVMEPVRAEWVPPRRDMIDPEKETKNVKERIRNGFTTWPDALRELGVTDPKQHAVDIAASNKMLDELGLILDCDPRKSVAPGAQASQEQSEPTDDEPPETPDDDSEEPVAAE